MSWNWSLASRGDSSNSIGISLPFFFLYQIIPETLSKTDGNPCLPFVSFVAKFSGIRLLQIFGHTDPCGTIIKFSGTKKSH